MSLEVGVYVIFRLTHSFPMLFLPFSSVGKTKENKLEGDVDYYLISAAISVKARANGKPVTGVNLPSLIMFGSENARIPIYQVSSNSNNTDLISLLKLTFTPSSEGFNIRGFFKK